MNDKQLPPLPTLLRTRVVDGVPCLSVSEHEYQMREYALQAIAHATQPAEVTDEQLCEALGIDGSDDWTYTVRDAVETHHGIKPKEQA